MRLQCTTIHVSMNVFLRIIDLRTLWQKTVEPVKNATLATDIQTFKIRSCSSDLLVQTEWPNNAKKERANNAKVCQKIIAMQKYDANKKVQKCQTMM